MIRATLAIVFSLALFLLPLAMQAESCGNAEAWVQSHNIIELDSGSKSAHVVVNGEHWQEMTQPARRMVAKQISRCLASGGYVMIKFAGSDAFRAQWSPTFGYKEF